MAKIPAYPIGAQQGRRIRDLLTKVAGWTLDPKGSPVPAQTILEGLRIATGQQLVAGSEQKQWVLDLLAPIIEWATDRGDSAPSAESPEKLVEALRYISLAAEPRPGTAGELEWLVSRVEYQELLHVYAPPGIQAASIGNSELLSNRARNVLIKQQILTAGELQAYLRGDPDLENTESAGVRTLWEFYRALHDLMSRHGTQLMPRLRVEQFEAGQRKKTT